MRRITNIILLIFTIFIVACKDDENNERGWKLPYTVLMLVNEYEEDDDYGRIIVLKNGSSWMITDKQNISNGRALAISGNDVYVVGSVKHDSYFTPAYWKNNELHYLSSERYFGYATDIAFEGEDVYISGSMLVDNVWRAYRWKNEVPLALTDGSYSMEDAVSVNVVNADVYVGGLVVKSPSRFVPAYWKNSEEVLLTDGVESIHLYDVHATGTIIHSMGIAIENFPKQKIVYFQNDELQDITDGTHAVRAGSMHVTGDDVYITGSEQNDQNTFVAKVWKNGTARELTDGTEDAFAAAVVVKDSDLIAVGKLEHLVGEEYIHRGFYTINNKVFKLPKSKTKSTEVVDVLIIE